MSILTEKDGMSRRRFLKGSGVLAVSALLGGIFAKYGFNVYARSTDYIAQRAAGLYTLDEKMTLRKSHENPEIAQIYKEFLSPGEVKPLSEKAHHLLHTRYGNDIPSLISELKKDEHPTAA